MRKSRVVPRKGDMDESRGNSSRVQIYAVAARGHHDEQHTQPRAPASLSASMTAVIPLKSDHSPSALNPATVSAADTSAPSAIPRQAPTDEVPYQSRRRSHPYSLNILNNSQVFF